MARLEHLPRTGAGGCDLLVGALGESDRPGCVRQLDSFAEPLPGLLASVRSAKGRAKVDEGARVLDACLRACECGDCLAELLFTHLRGGYEAERPESRANSVRGARAPSEYEFLLDERARFVVTVKHVKAFGPIAAPRDQDWVVEGNDANKLAEPQ